MLYIFSVFLYNRERNEVLLVSGKFITFEGGEGSGKTTIAAMVKEVLDKEGLECVI